MKRLFCIIMAASALVWACGKDNDVKDPDEQKEPEQPVEQTVPATGVKLNRTELTLEINDTETLKATLEPANTTDSPAFEWSSSAPEVASVNNGIVKALSAGEAVITVKQGSLSAGCKVTVPEPEQPSEGWDGETFIDRSADWAMAYTDHGGWWSFDINSCTAKYHLIKYIMEGEDFMGAPEDIRYEPVNIRHAYEYFCVNVDESYLVNAVSNKIPDMVELLWPENYGRAQGYVFGFDENKKFTGEYAHLTSEHVF